MAKRILFIDVLRGVGILGVLLSHAALYGVYYGESNALEVLPDTAILLLTPLIILITWTGLFAIITGLVNAYAVYRRLERGVPLNVALSGPIVNATMVYILHLIYRLLFNHRSVGLSGEPLHSLITGWIETGSPVDLKLMQFYMTEALHMIAVTGWLTCFLIWLLWRDGGHKLHRRNFKILLWFSLIWLALYSPVFNLFRSTYVDWYYRNEITFYVITFILKSFWGGLQVLLPYGGFGSLGLIFGTWFAYEEDYSRIYQFCIRFGLLFVIAGITITLVDIMVIHKTLDELLEFDNLPPMFVWFNLGTMLWFIGWLVWLMEDRPLEYRVHIADKTQWIRQFGVLALTIFFFESAIHAIFARIFHAIFGNPNLMKDDFMFNPIAIIVYLVVIYSFWFFILALWKRKFFAYSLEWAFVNVGSLFRSAESTRPNIYAILDNPLGLDDDELQRIREMAKEYI